MSGNNNLVLQDSGRVVLTVLGMVIHIMLLARVFALRHIVLKSMYSVVFLDDASMPAKVTWHTGMACRMLVSHDNLIANDKARFDSGRYFGGIVTFKKCDYVCWCCWDEGRSLRHFQITIRVVQFVFGCQTTKKN